MDMTALLCALVSTVDRAGVPVALVVGVLHLQSNDMPLALFVLACVAAGLLGDLAMFWLGTAFRRKPQEHLPRVITARLLKNTLATLVFIETAPMAWLVFGRAFQMINQFIPMAAGVRGLSFIYVLRCCLVGNILWFVSFALLVSTYGEILSELSRPVALVGFALGVFFVWLSLRLVQRKCLRGSSLR